LNFNISFGYSAVAVVILRNDFQIFAVAANLMRLWYEPNYPHALKNQRYSEKFSVQLKTRSKEWIPTQHKLGFCLNYQLKNAASTFSHTPSLPVWCVMLCACSISRARVFR